MDWKIPFDPISFWSQETPHKKALFSLTYREFDELITGIEESLQGCSNRIAFLATPTAETLALFFACWRQNLIACPLSVRLPPEGLTKALQALDTPLFQASPIRKPSRGIISLQMHTLATLLFTSGTTSTPKIAAHTLENHFTSALETSQLLNLTNQDRYLLNLPLSHVSGLAAALRTFVRGATLVENLKEATHISMVSTQLYRLLQDKPSLPSLKCLLIGGAPLSLHPQNLPLYICYGMTETSSFVALTFPTYKTLPSVSIRISPSGEIEIQGKVLFQGYWQKDAPLSLPLKEGWFPTQDLSTTDKLQWKGRRDRQFISGGENIQPEEIEEALLSIPGVIQASVKPKADPEFGQIPQAFLYSSLSDETIKKALREKLPGYKIPKEFVRLNELFLLK